MHIQRARWAWVRVMYVRDDAGLVLAGLEMGVGEKEEDLAQLAMFEKVRQELHCIRANNTNVLVAARDMTSLTDHALVLAALLRVLVVGLILPLRLGLDIGLRGILQSTLLVCQA